MLGCESLTHHILTTFMQRGHYRVVQALLKKGANPDKPSSDGYTPLAAAAKVRHQETSSCWGASHSPTMLLSGVLQRGDAEVIKMLLEAGASANEPMPDGYTPLAAAAEVRHQAMSSSWCASWSLTVLLSGVLQNGDTDVVEMLLEAGASADEPMPDGYTPLAAAAKVRHQGTLSGWDVSCSVTKLLSGVMQRGDAEVVEMLLVAGASADEPMPDGYTPLAAAAKVRHQETSSCWDASRSLTMLLSCR